MASEQDKRIRDLLGGEIVKASGGNTFKKGDVLTDYFHIEGKDSKENRINLKKEWLDKAKRQAFERGKEYYCLVVGLEGEDYYCIDGETFRYMNSCLKIVENIMACALNGNIEKSIIDTQQIGEIKEIIKEGLHDK